MERFRFYFGWLIGICVLFFFIQLAVPGFTDAFVLNQHAFGEPWRFVTAIFLHGDLGHLLYNMFALLFFGGVLERLVGGKRFLLVYFVTGIGANLFSVFFYPSSLGASGAIFGVIGALVLIRPSLTVFAFGMPMPMFLAGIFWGVGDIIGAVGYFTGNPVNNTGNLAHLSGMALGLFFGAVYRSWSQRREKKVVHRFDEDSMQQWEDRWMR
ncbi:MAG: rhomboid family intramembrane serine protease [Nanoarchaeota archaeon]